ncbi:helix-turn-helix domain-containing protein [Actinacidiphila glaucinigra]|uniref:helix-turn-helix domain-containing protein n=1 Tax=Actinacidiphila glaucinigra TaxID=235986 RepID=UPI0032546FC9
MNSDPAAWARLGQIIRDARASRGWTQEELAGRAGVSSRSIQETEYGRAPLRRMPPTLGRISKALEWPSGTIEAVLDGGVPPGWAEPEERPLASAEQVSAIILRAALQSTDNVTAAEMRKLTALVVDELRQLGLVAD